MSLSTRASMGSGKTIVRILIRGGFCEGGLPDRCSSVVRGRTLAGSHASEPSDGSSVLRDILTAVPSQYFIDEGLTSDAVPLIQHCHINSVYEMRGPAGPPCGSRVACTWNRYAVNSIDSCVRTVSDTLGSPSQTM